MGYIKKMIKMSDSTVLRRLNAGLSLTSKHDNPQYCGFCNKEKYDFLNPNTGRISLLACECEKYYFVLEDFLQTNDDWLYNPSKADKKTPNYSSLEEREKHIRFVKKAQDIMLKMQLLRNNNIKRRTEQNDTMFEVW